MLVLFVLLVDETSSGSVRFEGEIRSGGVEGVRESSKGSSGRVVKEEGGSLAEKDVVESKIPDRREALPVGDEGRCSSDGDSGCDVPPVIFGGSTIETRQFRSQGRKSENSTHGTCRW